MITKVKGRYVIGFENGEHIIYQDGEVVYEDDTIIYVGKDYNGGADEIIDEGNCIVSPGFVDLNAIGDLNHDLFFNEFPKERETDLQWSLDYFENHRKEEMSQEDENYKSLYAFTVLIMNGITTAMPITCTIYKKAGETYEEIEAAANHAGKLGLRMYLGPSYLQGKHVIDNEGRQIVKYFEEEDAKEGLYNAEKFIKEYDNAYDGLIKACVVPERIELQTEESIIKSKELARKYDCPIKLHAAQGVFEYDYIMENYGLSTIQYLDSLNFLDDKTFIPHAFVTSGYSKIEDQSDKDLDILRDKKVSVIHCPLVYARKGKALESFGRFVRKGINMTMGTDTFPADMIKNIELGSYLGKLLDDNKKENNLKYFFNAATINGAKALGRDDLGKLEVGAKADIIIVDLSRFEMGVTEDPIQTLILNGDGNFVNTSIINGKTVMKDRKIEGIDLDKLLDKAQEIHDKMKLSFMTRSRTQDLTEDEFFYQTYKVIK